MADGAATIDSQLVESPDWGLLLDVPARQPALGFDIVATGLARIVATGDSRLAIGIFGSWGSGKSTLMEAIERQLDPRNVVIVRFNAWRYQREDHLIIPLLDTVRAALLSWAPPDHPGSNVARQTARTVARALRALVAGVSLKAGLPGAVEVSFDANKALQASPGGPDYTDEESVPRSVYFACYESLRAAFEGFAEGDAQRRIVVFVDDLDRCLPDATIQLLESMKLFFDLTGFVFVLGLDYDIVREVVEQRYGRSTYHVDGGATVSSTAVAAVSGEEYLNKMFQVPFRLAPVSIRQLGGFIDATCREAQYAPEATQSLRDTVEPHLRYVLGQTALLKPREVKRFINTFTLQKVINPELDTQIILAMQVIAFQREWASIREGIFRWGDLYIDAVRRRVVRGELAAVSELDDDLGFLPGDFEEYVRAGNPGHPLLSVEQIDPYIFSGDAVRSTESRVPMRLIRAVTKARSEASQALKMDPLPDSFPISGLQKMIGAVNALPEGGMMDQIEWVKRDFLVKAKDVERQWADSAPETRRAVISTLEYAIRAVAGAIYGLHRRGEVALSYASAPPTTGASYPSDVGTMGSQPYPADVAAVYPYSSDAAVVSPPYPSDVPAMGPQPYASDTPAVGSEAYPSSES